MLNESNFMAYVRKMHQLNEIAAQEMQAYIDQFGFDNMSYLVMKANQIATKYGEGTSSLACLLYDYLAEHQGAKVPPAVPAPTATMDETWGAVQGALNESEKKVPDAVSRLVKQAGADTIQMNAARDHAEMAFVPVGDTCAFCLMLASRGWERVGKNAKSHAAHIHPNCDCQYIVRFSSSEGVAGYDPEHYKKIYYGADPNGNWRDKLNAIRRQQYANKPSIEFDSKISDYQKQIISKLASQYDTRLKTVTVGAHKAAGDVDMTGSRMRLSDKHANTAIHEFAHTIAMEKSDKLGFSDNKDFWKEIKKIRREYHKEVDDTRRWISFYEHSSRDVDEFMAEAFAHAKMKEMGIEIPSRYGSDFTYSQKVLSVIDKYFKK